MLRKGPLIHNEKLRVWSLVCCNENCEPQHVSLVLHGVRCLSSFILVYFLNRLWQLPNDTWSEAVPFPPI